MQFGFTGLYYGDLIFMQRFAIYVKYTAGNRQHPSIHCKQSVTKSLSLVHIGQALYRVYICWLLRAKVDMSPVHHHLVQLRHIRFDKSQGCELVAYLL